MTLLTNPILIRMAVALLIAMGGFIAGIFFLRLLRRHIVESDALSDDLGQESVYPYTAVIQQLKQQKFVLQNEQQIQQRRAKTAEQITATVIANLPCGILFFAPNGLVRQANAAARQILGFASPLGMSAQELFRDARVISESGPTKTVAEMFEPAVPNPVRSNFEAAYRTASGIDRALSFTVIPVSASSGEALGTALVILDESAAEGERRAHVLHSEVSTELALELRTSLGTIRECAAKMSGSQDRHSVVQLAGDIAAETERLDKVVGGFLAGGGRVQASAAGA